MAENAIRVIDIDGHVREADDLWERYLEPPFRSRAPKIQRVPNGQLLFLLEGNRHHRKPDESPFQVKSDDSPVNEHRHLATDPRERLKDMDRDGIERGMLFPSAGLYLTSVEEEAYAAALCRSYNNWLYDYCGTDRKRLMGVGVIPVQDVQSAIHEARRVIVELGFKAIFMRPNPVKGRTITDPYYEPLWDTLEELNLPLGFHEASGSRSRQAGEQFEPNFGLRRIYSQPFEQMMGLGSFLGGGILHRHPKLKVAFLEANCSWLPWLLWRLDEGYEREGDIFMTDLTMAPSEYFKRQCFISVEPDEIPARHTIADFGCDQLVFSTDYPHGDSKYPHAVESFLKLSLSDEDKRKILWDNCARFYAVNESSSNERSATSHAGQALGQ